MIIIAVWKLNCCGLQAHNKTRYFILKSINSENIQRAVSEGIWATQVHNEVKLNEAFRGSERVILIFSVNASGHFQVGTLFLYSAM